MKQYKALLYFIAITIAVTIGIQVYWNIQNYTINKNRILNDVQISLDNAVETYYAECVKTDFFINIDKENSSKNGTSSKIDSIRAYIDEFNLNVFDTTQLNYKTVQIFHNEDSIQNHSFHGNNVTDTAIVFSSFNADRIKEVSVKKTTITNDSLNNLSSLFNKLTISFTKDSIAFKSLDSLLNKELKRKKIDVDFGLNHYKQDSIFNNYNITEEKDLALATFSKSTYLPPNQRLELKYSSPTLAIFQRSIGGILLSTLLSICIISCLFYLLHVIKKQKELAEIKNDLISNITHEFKTPIATVSTAIEGIKNFNDTNDKEKTDKYLDISNQQLKKLHAMVEKLLETATLDSDKLIINTENIDLVLVLKNLVEKYQMLSTEKHITFKSNNDSLTAEIDPFHFENVLANLIDNAIKYGGNTIEVNLNSLLNSVEITVADNGGKIDKSQREKIFDKFYRIPTGNRHDVKGFGIGLFYSKKIVEKHNGQLFLVPDTTNTIFKIVL